MIKPHTHITIVLSWHTYHTQNNLRFLTELCWLIERKAVMCLLWYKCVLCLVSINVWLFPIWITTRWLLGLPLPIAALVKYARNWLILSTMTVLMTVLLYSMTDRFNLSDTIPVLSWKISLLAVWLFRLLLHLLMIIRSTFCSGNERKNFPRATSEPPKCRKMSIQLSVHALSLHRIILSFHFPFPFLGLCSYIRSSSSFSL